VYDLIPLRRPEWCSRRLVGQFSAWFERIVGECDVMFAISRATAADLKDHAGRHGIALPSVVRAIPIGSGFGRTGNAIARDGPLTDDDAERTALPPAGSYVLMVATIEARKNHALMVRVWQQLLAELPADAVPTLVFAGRVGWLASDLLQRIENDHRLDGKLVMIGEPSDGALRRLYQGCLFTVFPSLYEGWGLPVTESFTFGKPCVCANTTSLPEAGGTLARYFDPDDVAEACRVIRDTVLDRAGLAAWEARIGREFSPVSWQVTVDAIMAGLVDSLAAPCIPAEAPAQAVVNA
jgi:glycosyltransferase involved in cell wall biosynthesis